MKEFDRELVFEAIYEHNLWGGKESRSGTGSDKDQVQGIAEFLLEVIDEYNISSMLDVPCGDFNWMQDVEFPIGFDYVGADIVSQLIEDNQEKYPDVLFRQYDLVSDEPSHGFDLIFCRDLLGHLSHIDTVAAITNIRRSKPRYLIATTFPNAEKNPHIKTGQWRPINLEHYGLKPVKIYNEGLINSKGENSGKSLGLYVFRG